jgi:hypothetical protein
VDAEATEEKGNNMLSYHSDPNVKEKYLTRVRTHREADRLMQGYGYWLDGKGCAVGCTLEYNGNRIHARYETELGIPQILARLEDRFFEGLPQENAREWPERFLSAIPVGADLSQVWPKFAIWLLTEHRPSVSGKRVADLYARQLQGEKITAQQWRAEREAAYEKRREHSAAAAAASAAAYAAYADAYAAAYADAYAAAAAASAAAAYAAYADAYAAVSAAAAYAAYADAYAAVSAAADAAAAAAAYAAYADAYAAVSAAADAAHRARQQSYVAQAEKLLAIMAEATAPVATTGGQPAAETTSARSAEAE